MHMARSDRRGQSITEAMLAISMLTVGFLGITALLSRSYFLSRVTADQLTATYLASEGIEIAKNMIDHDIYNGVPWDTTFGGGGDFHLDYTACTNGAPCPPAGSAGTGPVLDLDPATHLYSYSGSIATKFTRLIRITVPSGHEIQVNSIVTWSTGLFTAQSINLEDHFYNWHP